jgi:hypothetical protein
MAKGALPQWDPRPRPGLGRPNGQEISKICRGSMKQNPSKCRGLWLVRE